MASDSLSDHRSVGYLARSVRGFILTETEMAVEGTSRRIRGSDFQFDSIEALSGKCLEGLTQDCGAKSSTAKRGQNADSGNRPASGFDQNEDRSNRSIGPDEYTCSFGAEADAVLDCVDQHPATRWRTEAGKEVGVGFAGERSVKNFRQEILER